MSISTSASEFLADTSAEAMPLKRKARSQSPSFCKRDALEKLLEEDSELCVDRHIREFYNGSTPLIEMLSWILRTKLGMPSRNIGESSGYLRFEPPVRDRILLPMHGFRSLDQAEEPCKLITVLKIQLLSLLRHVLECKNILQTVWNPSECLLIKPKYAKLIIEQLQFSKITYPYL